ncbi:MAG: DNA repair protein RecN [Betaproteobacteria bacterium]|nr:DNA repair protein RecN [Betaproteobacteria bacterium]
MLKRIAIRDFVIVEHSVLEFDAGFTVLTGETGAGKSILIDALSLLLGERADAGMIRAGAKQAEVSAEFELERNAETLAAWLAEAGLEGDPGICLVRRSVETGGRSRAFVNGHATTVAQLRELSEMLVDIHGQHAHQSLTRPAAQRELIDAYAGCVDLAREVGALYRRSSELESRYAAARSDAARLALERDELRWQAAELERLDFQPEPWAELNAEHVRAANAASLIEAASAAIETLADGELAATRLMATVASRLSRAAELDPELAAVLEMIEGAQIQIGESVHELERYRSRLDIDPARLAQIESRLQAVHDACRKFRLTPQALPSALQAAQARLAELEHDLDLSRLEREIAEAKAAYRPLAAKLTAARRKAAAKLGREVTSAMQELALSGGRFEAAIEPLAEATAHGMERIEFRVAAHASVDPGPLAKVASGGELSRLSLAIQSALMQVAQVPTLIFDEVDAGIGGRVAEIVGRMLRRLALRHQVMCVTHLAQVAACAEHHWRVSKDEHGGAVASRVQRLDGSLRVDELARMLGGLEITRATREHATEMLRAASRWAASS